MTVSYLTMYTTSPERRDERMEGRTHWWEKEREGLEKGWMKERIAV